jgi:hypothetical protein
MLRFLFVCDACGVEAPTTPTVSELPKGWLHRTIVDQSNDARGTLSLVLGTLERHRHYCPGCRERVAA